ncbi:MAG TPA: hypothetical protein DCY51_09925, partial [Bacteroidetes bacterium]|nr:hypothetical protein [Bacteroidota bacterium]
MAIKFLNSVNADSGVLYVDAANDKVGIGTTSPNRKLTIQNGSYTYPGGIDANSFFAIANDGWAGMNILSSRGTGGFIDFGDLDWGHRGRILYGQSTDYMSFDTAGSTKMTILSGGNVGIGTTSPEGKLNIVADNGSTASAVKTLVLGGGTDTTGNGQYIQFRSSSNATLGSQISGSRTGAGAASDLKFHTTGSDSVVRERMVINSSGNVGIGTTSPIGLLTVQGDDADIYLRSNDYTIARIINRGSSGTNLDTGLFSLMSSDGTNNNVEQVRLDAGGNSWLNALNVGIGTNSPASRLHVYENSDVWHAKFGSATGELRIGGQTSSGAVIQAYTPAGVVRDLYLQRDGGNVGIGTASPGAKLDISGDTTTWSGMAKIFLTDSNSNSNSRNWSIGNGGTDFGSLSFIVSNAKDGVPEASTGTPVMSMDGVNKRIGIGTASPTEKLHVSGNVRIEGDLTVNGSYTQIDTDVNTTEQWNVTNDGTGPAVTINQTGAQDIMDVQDDGTSVFYIEDGGNVGLGTTDPANNLEVSNSNSGGLGATLGIYNPGYNANSSSTINIGRTSDSNWEIKSESNADGGRDYDLIFSERDKDDTAHEEYLRLKSTGALKISSYGSNTFTGTAAYALAVDSSGNVIETSYIPSSSSTDFVAVTGDTMSGGLNIEVSTSNTQLKLKRTTSATGEFNIYTNTDSLFFHNVGQSTYPMMINSSGNVGIGTTNPVSHSQNRRTLVVSDTTDGANVEIWGNSSGKSILQSVGGNTYVGNLANGSGNGTTYITSGNGSTYTTILANGNVGIGTTSPGSSLQIEAPAGGQQMFRVTNHTSAAGTFTNNYAAEIRSAYTTGAAGGALLVHTQEANDARPTMAVSDQNGVFTTFVNGKVGIGTTSPSNKLHVYGGRLVLDNVANAQTAIQINSAGVEKIVIYRPASTEDLRINTFSAGDVFSLTQSGNVGIGDSGPAVKLQVSTSSPTNNVAVSIGDGWVGNDLYHKEGGLLLISGTSQDSTQTGAGLAFQTRNTQNTNYWKSSIIMDRDGAMRFTLGGAGTVQGSEDLTILSGGNVGIGRTAPVSVLELGDDTPTLTISDTGNNYNDGDVQSVVHLSGRWYSGTANPAADVYSDARVVLRKDSGDGTGGSSLAFETSANGAGGLVEAIRIDKSQNVGIGTTDPNRRLYVVSSDDTRGIMVEQTLASSYAEVHFKANREYRIGTGGSTSAVEAANNWYVYDATAAAQRFVITSSGNVGIGTTDPGYKLDVTGDARFGDGNNFNPLIQYAGSGRVAASPGYSFVGDLDTGMFNPNLGNTLAFATGAVERMRITADGNVGIGT